MGYHSYLSQLTMNNIFEKAIEIVEKMLHVYLRDIVAFHGNERSIQQHEACFEAIAARDTEKAVSIMAEHYDMLISRLKEWLEMDEAQRNEAILKTKK